MAIVDLASTLHGKYGDGARYLFEFLCGALILEESLIRQTEFFKLPHGGQVFSIAVSKGDGGLDIIHQSGDEWIVFQCKFLFKTTLGQSDYKDSFETSLETAKAHGKKIVKWVLCIPKDLTAQELNGWNRFKNEKGKLVQIELIPQNVLISVLNQYMHIRDLYISPSVNTITLNSQIKTVDRVILEDILDQIQSQEIIETLKVATGYENDAYVYIPKSSLQEFQSFVSSLTKMRTDFNEQDAFRLYDELRDCCKDFIRFFSWAYRNVLTKNNRNLYLGFDVNPIFRTQLSDAYIYRERLTLAIKLYDNFIEKFNNMESYYNNMFKSSPN